MPHLLVSAWLNTDEQGSGELDLGNATASRSQHFATVFGLIPSSQLSTAVEAFLLGMMLEMPPPCSGSLYGGSDSALADGLAERNLYLVLLYISTSGTHHQPWDQKY